jgi:hypothetical protein
MAGERSGEDGVKKYFRPQEDITAYEAAVILSHIPCGPLSCAAKTLIIFSDELWIKLGVLQRHFSSIPQDQWS